MESSRVNELINLIIRAYRNWPFRFHLLPGQWWELMLNIKPASRSYDPMSGNTTWTARGAGGQTEVRSHGVTFTFRRTERPGWRSSVEDGQIPHFYFWKL